MEILYFAYGSCMDEEDFKRTVESFQVVGPATLRNYQLAFTIYGKSRHGGVVDIIPATGAEVQGVLYTFPQEFLPALDAREGVHEQVYERISVEVEHEEKRTEVYTYQVVTKEENEISPSEYYLQLMLNGMNAYATGSYISSFKQRMKDTFGILLHESGNLRLPSQGPISCKCLLLPKKFLQEKSKYRQRG